MFVFLREMKSEERFGEWIWAAVAEPLGSRNCGYHPRKEPHSLQESMAATSTSRAAVAALIYFFWRDVATVWNFENQSQFDCELI
jgi:hypothetical protein